MVKLTKKLQDAFRKYGVKLRKENSVVEHEVNKTKTELTPLEFGVYELGLKANYLSWVLAADRLKNNPPPDTVYIHPDSIGWMEYLLNKDGIDIPKVVGDGPGNAAVYHWCCRLLSDKYYELFD